jgi:VRR-NUC domain
VQFRDRTTALVALAVGQMTRRNRHPEDDHAMALMRWVRLHERSVPELSLLFHIPNGGRRNVREAARLKAMGVKAGVSDYFLPVPQWDEYAEPVSCMISPGLWIELKAGKNRPTPAQFDWQHKMQDRGYDVRICTGWIEAAKCIAYYLGREELAP